jgi:DNA-binding CsgD family transcriptional regulator
VNKKNTKRARGRVGICVRSQDETVLTQDPVCAELCGRRIGLKCEKGCMLRVSPTGEGGVFDEGVHLFRNVQTENQVVDAVVINDGKRLTTLLFDKRGLIKKQMGILEKFGLSRAERCIMEKYLSGFSNGEIAAELFISKTTLRTHLNNIYKKLPDGMKEVVMASHLGKSGAKRKKKER